MFNHLLFFSDLIFLSFSGAVSSCLKVEETTRSSVAEDGLEQEEWKLRPWHWLRNILEAQLRGAWSFHLLRPANSRAEEDYLLYLWGWIWTPPAEAEEDRHTSRILVLGRNCSTIWWRCFALVCGGQWLSCSPQGLSGAPPCLGVGLHKHPDK